MEYGNYVIVQIHSKFHGECTNVGVIVYDKDGKLHDFCMDTIDRAVRRGDCEDEEWLRQLVSRYAEAPARETLEDVKTTLRSDGHYMGHVQMTEPRGTIINDNTLDNICRSFGIRTQEEQLKDLQKKGLIGKEIVEIAKTLPKPASWEDDLDHTR